MPSPSRPFLVRLILPFTAVLALIVGVCGAAVYWAGERATRAQQVQNLNHLAPIVRQWVEGADVQHLDDARRRQLTEASRVLDTRITLIDGRGEILFDTHHDPHTMENHNGRPEILAARGGGVGVDIRQSGTIDKPSVYVATLLDPARPDGAIVRISDTKHAWDALDGAVWPVLAGAVAAALLTCALLWLVLQRQWIAPTHQLAHAAERMAAGEWGQRVAPSGAPELRAFSNRLNLVASHAQRQLEDLRHQRADLQALVDTLPDPILLSNPHGRVTLINTPAAHLLDLAPAQAIGQPVVNVVNDEAVLQMFERGLEPARSADGAAQTPLMREVRLFRRGQWLTFHAVATGSADGRVLLVLRDMTGPAAAVQMKTDFVANASHELRTPIAAIKIAFETLRDVVGDDAQQTERCVQIIDGHLRRLEEMLRDLLDLSRVESAALKPHVRRLKTAEVFAQIRSSLGPMARQKGVEIRTGGRGTERGLNGDDEPPEFLGDERLLNLVLKNLVENSIKFTPAGGSVSIGIRDRVPPRLLPAAGSPEVAPSNADGTDVRRVAIAVADTGSGIPPEHLDRVFERFYQVDPARSGSAGRGTGLGLAIVKHAVAALGGTVHIDSTVGKGTTVTIVLPQRGGIAEPLESNGEPQSVARR